MSAMHGLRRLQALPVIPAAEFFTARSPACPSTASAVQPPDQRLTERQRRFCKALIDHPLLPSSQYPRLLGVSSKTAVQLRRDLVERGMIHERRIDGAGRGRSTILLEISRRGREAVAACEATTGPAREVAPSR